MTSKPSAVEWRRAELTLRGVTPLVVASFDRSKKAPKEPKECYEQARLRDSRGRDCVAASWIKCAWLAAARYVEGLKQAELRAAFFIEGDLLPIKYKKRRMRCDSFRMPSGVVERYRPEYTDWSVDIAVRFRPDMTTADSLVNLLNNAGQSIGLCARRPEHGMFEVQRKGKAA